MENTDKLSRLGIKTISQFGERYRDFLDSLEERVFGEYVGYKLNLSQNELIYIQEKSMKTIKLYDYSEFPMSGTWAIVKDSSIHYEKGGKIKDKYKKGDILMFTSSGYKWTIYKILNDLVIYKEFNGKYIQELPKKEFEELLNKKEIKILRGKMAKGGSIEENEEINYINEMIELYDSNYNRYRKRYLQTENDEDKYNMNKWLNLRKEQEELLKNKKYNKGGSIEENENALMVSNNNKQIAHHTKELEQALMNNEHVPAWVVAKVNRSASDLSDATHYLDGTSKMETGGKIKNQYENMSPSQIWSSWNYNQRLHFLEDHIHLSSKDKTYYADLDYSDLTETIQDVIHVHTKSGQYAEGGLLNGFSKGDIVNYEGKQYKVGSFDVLNNKTTLVYLNNLNDKPAEDSIGNYLKVNILKIEKYAEGGSTPTQRKKVAKVMHEWKEGELHSGSKKGPIVKKQKQAVAIALSEAGLSKKVDGGQMMGWKHKNK